MVYVVADNIISSLGFTTSENFEALKAGNTGISVINNRTYYPELFPASLLDETRLNTHFTDSENQRLTKLEKMIILSVKSSLNQAEIDISSEKTGIILSTTKGNIDLLSDEKKNLFDPERVLLWKLGQVISDYFKNPNEAMVLSNACVSGVLAINNAAMLIENGRYESVVVAGADIVSRFVLSGFMSFMSLSSKPCKPFDKSRDGLSLGEAASTIILTNNKPAENSIAHVGGASANDANHISGPSKTGEGSFIAIKKALDEAGIGPESIQHISAHGTATLYNDEMESIAIDRNHLAEVPVSSFKGSFGHTLGAAGLVETSILIEEMRNNILVKTTGFSEPGFTRNINVVDKTVQYEINTVLKMASGFGGSNAALVLQKV